MSPGQELMFVGNKTCSCFFRPYSQGEALGGGCNPSHSHRSERSCSRLRRAANQKRGQRYGHNSFKRVPIKEKRSLLESLTVFFFCLPPWWYGCIRVCWRTSCLLLHTGPSRCSVCQRPHGSHLWHRQTYTHQEGQTAAAATARKQYVIVGLDRISVFHWFVLHLCISDLCYQLLA